jgi:glycosyltransferase involved in cell wall biosynthesis
MTYSVLLLSRYERKGPSSRVRHYHYIPALERAGFRVTTAPLLNNEYLDRFYRGERRSPQALIKAYWRRLQQLFTARRYALIWIEKEALPWLPAAFERVLFGKQPVVIDFDDPWNLRYTTHWNPAVRLMLGHKLETVVAHAKVVTAGSAALAEWAKSSNKSRVIEMPPAVDIERYPAFPPPDGPFTIGWIGTPRNDEYLRLIAEPLRYLKTTYGARLRMIGASERFSLPDVSIDHVCWREETEGLELARCHVGIMPLSDGPWERGKCGYKLIQYMAAARPAVASPLGASTSIIVPGKTGFLASSTEEWIAALSGLASDRERARTMGLAARQRAEAMYSLQLSAAKMVEILLEVVTSTGATKQRKRTDCDRWTTSATSVQRATAHSDSAAAACQADDMPPRRPA